VINLLWKDIQEQIYKSIEKITDDKLKKKQAFNRYIEGRIISVDTVGKKCTVKINDGESTIPYRDGLTLVIGDVVMIMIPNNNFSAKFVDLKRP